MPIYISHVYSQEMQWSKDTYGRNATEQEIFLVIILLIHIIFILWREIGRRFIISAANWSPGQQYPNQSFIDADFTQEVLINACISYMPMCRTETNT